ncbi:TIGR01777 family oxidoreductase [Modestobacter lapidis]|nr:TIGR01777 family protein [Modestobacter lapidis]
MKVAITGSSGLIGTALVPALRSDGHEVLRLVRRTPRTADEHRWAPDHRRIDVSVLADVDAVVNLAGVGIGDRRWTAAYQRQVVASRVDSTATVSEALADAAAADPGRPRVLLSASGVGYYGDTGDRPVDESAPAGADFLADVCRQWEAATAPAADAGVRVVLLRTGLVLAEGGMMSRIRPLFRLGLGGKLGSGKQYWPWISLRDEVDAIRFLLTGDVSGPVNLTGPDPVTNAEFTRTLSRLVHRPAVLPVPGTALSVALGGFARVGVLAGQRAVPTALTAAGFQHTDQDLESALRIALSTG